MLSAQKRFYRTMLGRKAPAKKPLRKKETLYYAIGKSSLGAVLVATSSDGIVAVMTGDTARDLPARLQRHFATCLIRKNGMADDMLAQVLAYIKKPTAPHDLPLDLRGTVFQRRIWQAVQAIPAGTLATYSDIAVKAGAAKAVRAVGSSCTRCPIALLIPCHRVVHKGTDLPQLLKTKGRKSLFLKWDQRFSVSRRTTG